MKRSGDLVMGGSGDWKGEFTAEARRRGEKNFQDLITETHSHEDNHRDGFFFDHPTTRDHLITRSLNPCHPERHRATQEQGKVEGLRASVLYHAASGSSYETISSRSQAGSYQGPGFSRAVMSKKFWALAPAVFRRGMTIFRATLREIFDESAYDRFLLRTQRQHSVESYRAFMIERDAAAATKPRCC